MRWSVVLLGGLIAATSAGVMVSAEQILLRAQDDRVSTTLVSAARLEVAAAPSTTVRVVRLTLTSRAALKGGPLAGPVLLYVETGELVVIRAGQERAQATVVLAAGDQLALPTGTAFRVVGGEGGPVTFGLVALIPTVPLAGAAWVRPDESAGDVRPSD